MEHVNLWSAIGGTLKEMLVRLLTWTRETVELYAPGLLSAILVLALSWVLASLLRNIVAKLLRAVGFDVIAERTGLRGYLRQREIALAPSAMAGWALYIAIVYTAIEMAFDRVGIEAGGRLLREVAAFLPKLLVVVVLLGLGVWLSRWIGGLIGRAARLAGVPFHALIGTLARAAGIVLTVLISLDYLGVATRQTLLAGLGVVVAGAVLIGALFAICARELMGNLLAKNFVAGEFHPGDRVRVAGVEGEIEAVGATVVRLRGADRTYLVPHHRFIIETVERLPRAPAPSALIPDLGTG